MKRTAEEIAPVTIDSIFEEYRPMCQEVPLSHSPSSSLKAIERYLPRAFDTEKMIHFFGESRYAYDTESATNSLLKPMWDLLDRGGKRWRPVLVMLFVEALGGNKDVALPMAYLCEIVHNGTLCVDDIEDDSKLRRGKDCVHLIYGVDVAVNAGNAMYYFPLAELRDMRKKNVLSADTLLRAYELYGEELTNLHLGQGLDIWWHSNHGSPKEDTYLQMCAYKTGVLARLSARLAALLSGASEETIKHVGIFAEAIGVAFQIQDDLLNLIGEEFAAKIAVVGEDIHEGKRTIMVLHTFEHASKEDSARLLEILNLHTNDEKLINEAIAIMKKTGSFEYASEVARKLVTDAWANVEKHLPDNEAKTKIKVFADYLISRKI